MVADWPPKDAHILILRAYDYFTLCRKRDCADVIKLRILRLEDYPRLFGSI